MMTARLRIIANACITRYDTGERTIVDIVNTYTSLTEANKQDIITYIYSIRPDIVPLEEPLTE